MVVVIESKKTGKTYKFADSIPSWQAIAKVKLVEGDRSFMTQQNAKGLQEFDAEVIVNGQKIVIPTYARTSEEALRLAKQKYVSERGYSPTGRKDIYTKRPFVSVRFKYPFI